MAGVLSRLSWLGIARETVQGIPAAPVAAVPVDQGGYEPQDTPGFLLDTALRASMGQVAGAVLGATGSAAAFSGPLFPDSGGYWLDNLFGDLSTTASATLGTAQLFAQAANAGDTAIYVAASLGSVSAGSVVQITDGLASEVVIAGTGSTGTYIQCPSTPLRFPHAITATAALASAITGYTHTFSVLNSGSGFPPTHTLTDTSGLTAGTQARCYPCASVAQLDLAGDPGAGWVTGKIAGAAWLSQPSAATTAYPSTSYVTPFAGWQATVTVGGVVPFAGAWALSMRRATVVYRGAQNPQNTAFIARGGLVVTGTLAYPDPSGETALLQMTQSGALPVQISVTNGIVGAGALALAVNMPVTQFVSPTKLDRTHPALAYAATFQALDDDASAGGSGGIGPAQVQLTNGQAAY